MGIQKRNRDIPAHTTDDVRADEEPGMSTYSFPREGVVIRATSYPEAVEKLKEKFPQTENK